MAALPFTDAPHRHGGAVADLATAPGDTHLRSLAAVRGCHVHASDGAIGHVADFLIEVAPWGVRCMILDTRNWWPGRHVLMSPYAVKDISWAEHDITLDVTCDQVKTSPPWDPAAMLDKIYEQRVHTHHDWPSYGWRQFSEGAVAQTDAFALKNSALNEFLFAEIGDEQNGSSLTLLSMLARLGKDPWAEAARWATLPTAALTRILIDDMGRMPLTAQALRDAPGTAARLVGLLPQRRSTGQPGEVAVAQAATEGLGRLPLAFVLTALAMGIVVNLAATKHVATPPAAAAPFDPTVTAPKAG